VTEICIVTPSLNSAAVIDDCLRSVAEQSLAAEHVVVDGHSSDATAALVTATGGRVRLLQTAPQGIYAALNAGIRAASGEVVGILHADDFYAAPWVLDRVAAVFADPNVGACYGDLCYVDAADPSRVVRFWQAGAYRAARLRHGWMPPHPTFFARRRLYVELGLYREDLGTAADYELMLRFLLKHGIGVAYIPQVLVHMRTGGASNASWRARLAANRMDRRAWQVNGLRPYPWTTWVKPLRKVGQWWRRPPAINE
jgi:glycosyltransferase